MRRCMGMSTVYRIAAAVLATLLVASASQAAMPAVGRVAPDFTLKSDSGKNLKLSEYRGQVVMVNFWATWCGPCRQELPLLNRIHEQYRKAGFVLLGVNIDDQPAAAQAMMKSLGIRFPVLFDTEKRVSRLYDVSAMPSTLLIDRDGKLRHVHLGYKAGYETLYENQVRELLRQ
jgi:peroxiredoxin